MSLIKKIFSFRGNKKTAYETANRWKLLFAGFAMILQVGIFAFVFKEEEIPEPEQGCVFRTVFGEEPSDSAFIYNTPQNVKVSLSEGLNFIAKAQQGNGGWGAGSHSRQGVMDPHAVNADPATTAMVCMALLRNQNTLVSGQYSSSLKKGLDYLIHETENASADNPTITTEKNTQIQSKLGSNIDVIMTAQFFSNILDYLDKDPAMQKKVQTCLDICVNKIQRSQDVDGSFKGSGWAGVLQSSLANNALESAYYKGGKVDTAILEKSRSYQKGNYDTTTGKINTEKGAGVVLYSVTSTNRASAKEAREVQEFVAKAKKEGKWKDNDKVTTDNLQKAGLDRTKAMKSAAAYNVYENTKGQAQDSRVVQGFGNNGGEEFLSFLQTGESLIIGKDTTWRRWYENTSGRLLTIQNKDGSWSGHHCITSPVFCTATCMLVLSINNDMGKLMEMGGK
jgi:hypothetical protein